MGVYFANEVKKQRAEEIVDLLTGKRQPANKDESARIEHFARVCQANEIDLKDHDIAVQKVYIKLGGLLRNEEQQKKAEAVKKEAAKKSRTDKAGLRE